MKLVRAEISRFFSRRFIQIMLAALIIVFGITVFTVLSSSQTPTESMWAAAEYNAQQQRDNLKPLYEACLARKDMAAGGCDEYDPTRVNVEDYLWSVFNFARRIDGLVMMLSLFLGSFAFVVTASFIGSEMHSGGMTNLLLWRPNRMAVLGAKFGVALGLVAAVSTIFTAFYVGTFYALADSVGFIGNLAPPFWTDLAWLCARAIAVALLMAVLAFGIATIGRHTAAALGTLIAYVVGWEVGARIVLASLNNYNRNDESWFAATYVLRWLDGPTAREYWFSGLTWSDAVAFFVFVPLLAIAASFTTFHRRDLI